MRQRYFLLLILVVFLGSCSYSRQATIREEFDQSMKNYNKMLRWREIENAGAAYLDPELRDAFMTTAGSIRKRGVVITDYRILTSEFTPESNMAEVVAEFDYYTLPSNRIKTLTYRQNWVYFDTEGKKGWRLKSGLPSFD